MYKIWQTGSGLKRDKTHWFDFIITEILETDNDKIYSLLITTWEQKWKYSCIWESEIDEFLIFL